MARLALQVVGDRVETLIAFHDFYHWHLRFRASYIMFSNHLSRIDITGGKLITHALV